MFPLSGVSETVHLGPLKRQTFRTI